MRGFRVLGLVSLFWVGAMTADEPIERGQALASQCVACHQLDGNSTVSQWPSIAGEGMRYFIEQMHAFKQGDQGPRSNPVMLGIVQGLSDQDIEDLALYYNSQKMKVGSVPAQYVSLGEKIYRGGNLKTGVVACSGCHDPKGRGNPLAGFPPLGGQHAEYVIEQLRQFQQGTRRNDPNGIMRDISRRMSEEEIQAVAHYVSGLH